MRGPRTFHPVVLVSLLLALLAPSASAQRQIVLGNATVPLDGLWKFHVGDNMAWAQPDFDDSAWGSLDLTPPAGSYDPFVGSSGYVPGWTAQGYEGTTGFAWYRLRLNIQDGQSALALKMPTEFDDAYQVYVNGERVGESGKFTQRGVTSYLAQPQAFPLPASFRGGPVTIAVRLWMAVDTPLENADSGGLHGPPVLGRASAIMGLLSLEWYTIDRSLYSYFGELACLVLALLVIFALFRLDRGEPAYPWLGITCAALLAANLLNITANFSYWINANLFFLLEDALLSTAIIGLWVIFWATWFRLAGMARLHGLVWGLVALVGIGTAMLRAPFYGGVVPVHAVVWLSPLTLVLKLLLGVLLIWVTGRGIRKDTAEGWLALPAVALVAISVYANDLPLLHVTTTFFPFGVQLTLQVAGAMLSLAIVTVLLLRRFLRSQREREQWKAEIEQARQVQQMLIPEQLPAIPGLTIESEYRPAQQVGGDFFQILPDSSDGSVLIVVGDVTGHGLQAGMLVALIIGAIRNQVESSFDPLQMLETLNRRLCGRGHAHATSLAIRIRPDGAATLANAGHLPPYLNGRELPMEGAMLLGMMEGAEFSQMAFQLHQDDRLLLLSDGVAEAQDEHGNLFGFERIHNLLQQPFTAAEMANAAQNFGQEDDISVLSVTRTFSSAPAPV